MTESNGAPHHPSARSPVQVRVRGMVDRVAAIFVLGVATVVVGMSFLGQGGDRPPGSRAALVAPTATPTPDPTPEPTPLLRPIRDVATLPTGGTPLPDIAGAIPGDDGAPRLPLGTINDAPNADRLDFLFEFCWPECFRDAHWMDPQNPELGSGVWTAGRSFHVREGFINNREEPLGDGFDVVLYVTRMDDGPDAVTYRYTSDYVLRGTSNRCGPTYETTTGQETCEWFVHDFAEGLPEGRFAIWAVWEAPCRAWIDLELADACQDPDEVLSLFSSGFDAPYSRSGPNFTEMEGPTATPTPEPTPLLRPIRDVATLPTGGTPLPDIAGAIPGDDGDPRLPLGTINDAPNADRLDFLFEFCWPECFRDAHWMDPQNPELGSGVWTAGRSFHVREGFINNREEPLGDGFDVVLYVTRMDDGPDAVTYRYTSDYVLRGTSNRCGPTYETTTGQETCEWFVHDFAEGLPEGRFAIWAVWEAPCRAWIDLELADACQDPDEVLSLFSSGFDAPYSRSGPNFTEMEGPY